MVNVSASFFQILGYCVLLIPYAIIYIILSFPILSKYILISALIPKKIYYTNRLRDKKIYSNNNNNINNNNNSLNNNNSITNNCNIGYIKKENSSSVYDKNEIEEKQSISPFSVSSIRTKSLNVSYSNSFDHYVSKGDIASNLLSQEDELYDIGDADIEFGNTLNTLRKSASILGPLFVYILLLAPSIAFFMAKYIPLDPSTEPGWIVKWIYHDTYYIVWITISMILITSRPSISPPIDIFNILNIIVFMLPIFLNVYSEELFPDYTLTPFVSYMPVGNIALYWPSVSLLRITSLNLFVFRYVLYQPIPEVGFSLYLQLKDLAVMIVAVFFCAITSLPIGYSLGAFPGIDNLLSSTQTGADQAVNSICLLLLFGLIYFLVSLPVELICHGVIQNLFHLQYLYSYHTNSFISIKDFSGSISSLFLYFGANEVIKNNFPFLWTVYLPASDLKIDSQTESNSKASNYRVGRPSFIRRNRILNTFPSWQDLNSEFWLVDGIMKYLRWFALPTFIDFGILLTISLFYAFMLLVLILSPYADFMTYDTGCNKFYFPLIAFPITYASGWTWRITNKVSASALVNTFIIWFFVVYGKISFK